MMGKTTSSVIWSLSEIMFTRGAQFLIGIFLARLLMPDDFGLLGMIMIFITISQSIVDSGFSQALIREKHISEEDCSTVFFFNIIVSVGLYFILFAAANPVASFFGIAKLKTIIRVASFLIIINATYLIQQTLLIRNMDFKAIARISVTGTLISGVVAILLAYAGAGVWSLVVNILLGSAIQSVLMYINRPWKPLLSFSFPAFKKLFGFGSKLLISGLLDTVFGNVYYLIIGKLFDPTKLGYYTNAEKSRDVVMTNITSAIQRVAYPVFSQIHESADQLKSTCKKINKATMFFFFPLMIGLAVVAEPFYLVVFGEKWMGAVPFFRLLCFSGILYPLHAINLNILKAKGRSDLYLKLEIIKKVIFVLFIIVFIRWGIEGLLTGAILNSVLSLVINTHYSGGLMNYRILEQAKDVFRSMVCAVFMGAVAYMFQYLIIGHPLLLLTVQIITGIALYMVLSLLFMRNEVNTFREILNQMISRKRLSKNNKEVG